MQALQSDRRTAVNMRGRSDKLDERLKKLARKHSFDPQVRGTAAKHVLPTPKSVKFKSKSGGAGSNSRGHRCVALPVLRSRVAGAPRPSSHPLVALQAVTLQQSHDTHKLPAVPGGRWQGRVTDEADGERTWRVPPSQCGRAVSLQPNRACDVPWLSLTNRDAMCDSRRASSSSMLHCGLSLPVVGHRHALGSYDALAGRGYSAAAPRRRALIVVAIATELGRVTVASVYA